MKSTDKKQEENYMTIDVKIKPEAKNNPQIIINHIKDIDETCIKVLFFLYCYDNLNGIDVDYISECISGKIRITGEKIIEVLDFWQSEKVLEYCFSNTVKNNRDSIQKTDTFAEIIDTTANNIDTDAIVNPVVETQNLSVENTAKSRIKDSSPEIDRLSETLETKDDFRRLIHEVQQKFQGIFNPTDISIMYNLYEINKVDVDLLLKLTDACVLEGKPNVKYLERVAIGISSNGILTVEDYEKNYNELLKIKELEEKIIKIFKIKERKFTFQEKTYIKKWALEFNFSDDIFEESYNICMERLFGELKFGYINGILSNWHSKGFSMLEDIKTEFNKTKGFRATEAKTSSFNIDLFFERAVQKSMIHYDDDD